MSCLKLMINFHLSRLEKRPDRSLEIFVKLLLINDIFPLCMCVPFTIPPTGSLSNKFALLNRRLSQSKSWGGVHRFLIIQSNTVWTVQYPVQHPWHNRPNHVTWSKPKSPNRKYTTSTKNCDFSQSVLVTSKFLLVSKCCLINPVLPVRTGTHSSLFCAIEESNE